MTKEEEKRLLEKFVSDENMDRVFELVKTRPNSIIWLDELDKEYEKMQARKEKEKEVN